MNDEIRRIGVCDRAEGALLLTLKMEEGVMVLQKLKEERKQKSPLQSIERIQLCEQLEFSPVKPILYF